MKTLILEDKEFDFLEAMFKSAYENRDHLKAQMAESPGNKLLKLLEEMSGMVHDPDAKAKFQELKRDREKDQAEMYASLDSLHIKFSYLSAKDQ